MPATSCTSTPAASPRCATARWPPTALVKEFYDPFDATSVVKIFAEGMRNAYDLVWHSNGFLYVPTNGSAAGGRGSRQPEHCGERRDQRSRMQPDYLFRVMEGKYYGHPNPLRDHFILNGGNPTSGSDPNQVTAYPVGTQRDPDYHLAGTYSLLNSRSPNGAIEYMSNVFGNALQHALIFTQYSSGDNLRAVLFDQNGAVSDDFILRDQAGEHHQLYRPARPHRGRERPHLHADAEPGHRPEPDRAARGGPGRRGVGLGHR